MIDDRPPRDLAKASLLEDRKKEFSKKIFLTKPILPKI